MLSASLPRRPGGFSLLELMLGMTLGLLVLASVLAFYGTVVRSSADNLKGARLNQDLRATLNLISRELRRAGFWAAVPFVDDMTANPFLSTALGSDLKVGAFTGEMANSCITFTYDLDADKRLGVGAGGTADAIRDTDNVEQLGYRLRNGAIEYRTGGSPFSCTGGTWERLTEPEVVIAGLVFQLGETCLNVGAPGTACAAGGIGQYLRRVDVTLSGRLASDPLVLATLAGRVRVRNDKFLPVIP